jgi:hypothetical protein
MFSAAEAIHCILSPEAIEDAGRNIRVGLLHNLQELDSRFVCSRRNCDYDVIGSVMDL